MTQDLSAVESVAAQLLEDAICAGRLPAKPGLASLSRIAAILIAGRQMKSATGSTSAAPLSEVHGPGATPAQL